ncbi:uncharacterized protein TRAVEDRAFT_50985 [Trametes versicolor FP-101664 SS1]|uniref:uncharacterized protein n=1 Tax=Trametes versicolor (strain FP-101664) TaxID=717944 RepID=UPI0004623A8D|nr:uncharacterized protein TRAVEDRAFT_50985 [Trametes versicolor FP-101664 SS1]EIW54847.1 hypothetical protein TRAVEDRAFT_50985 [Trametes versicolor FP-101664 SS1]
MLNPSQERMYILSESTLLYAIEQGQLPSFHDPATHFTRSERSGNAPQEEVVQEASDVHPEVSSLFPAVVSPASTVQTTDASVASEDAPVRLLARAATRLGSDAEASDRVRAASGCTFHVSHASSSPARLAHPELHRIPRYTPPNNLLVSLPAPHKFTEPGFLQAASCFPAWYPDSDRFEGVDALLSQIASPSSDVLHPEYPAYFDFGHTSGGYDKPPT